MNILAIDPATETGWAVINGPVTHFGIWNLKKHKDESVGMRLLRFHSHLREVCSKMGVNLIAYEKPGGRNYQGIINHAKLVGVIEKFCEYNALDYRGFSASEIKKHATGKGNSNKPAMIKAAREKLRYEGDNENEADALWILSLMANELSLEWEHL